MTILDIRLWPLLGSRGRWSRTEMSLQCVCWGRGALETVINKHLGACCCSTGIWTWVEGSGMGARRLLIPNSLLWVWSLYGPNLAPPYLGHSLYAKSFVHSLSYDAIFLSPLRWLFSQLLILTRKRWTPFEKSFSLVFLSSNFCWTKSATFNPYHYIIIFGHLAGNSRQTLFKTYTFCHHLSELLLVLNSKRTVYGESKVKVQW